MHKKLILLITILLLTLTTACSTEQPNDNPDEPIENYLQTENSILADNSFSQGFALKSLTTTNAHVLGNLNYNGTTTREPFWQMAQWWAPEKYNFYNSTYKYEDSKHYYTNKAREAIIDSVNDTITLSLDSSLEYTELYGTPKKDPSASWSHFLLEQVFPTEVMPYVSELESLIVTLDFTINKADYHGLDASSSSEAAQFLLYLRLYHIEYDSNGKVSSKSNMWFGLPLYDSRYAVIPEYKHIDAGFTGATNSLIYSISNTEFISKDGTEVGITYHIEIDVLEYIKDAFIYGASNNYLGGAQWDEIQLRYMNLGWELPGAFDASATVSNLDIIATYSE